MNKPTADTGSLPGTALETVGDILDKDYGRDAVHIATVAVVAAMRLFPGQHIGLDSSGRASHMVEDLIGIVDPFVTHSVEAGNIFWLFLYPRTITSLRHVWTHPAFVDEGVQRTIPPEVAKAEEAVAKTKEASETWLKDFLRWADTPGYEHILRDFEDHYDGEEYFVIRDSDASGEIPPEFWDHMAVVTGRTLKVKPTYFSCSC